MHISLGKHIPTISINTGLPLVTYFHSTFLFTPVGIMCIVEVIPRVMRTPELLLPGTLTNTLDNACAVYTCISVEIPPNGIFNNVVSAYAAGALASEYYTNEFAN